MLYGSYGAAQARDQMRSQVRISARQEVMLRLMETFPQRFNAVGGGAQASIYNAADTATFMLEQYFAVNCSGQVVSAWHRNKAVAGCHGLGNRLVGPMPNATSTCSYSPATMQIYWFSWTWLHTVRTEQNPWLL